MWVPGQAFPSLFCSQQLHRSPVPWTQQLFPTKEPVGGSEVTWLPTLSLVKCLSENERLEKPASLCCACSPVYHGWHSFYNTWVFPLAQEEKRCLSSWQCGESGCVAKNVTHLKLLSGFLADRCGAGHVTYLSVPCVLLHKVGIGRTTS